MCYCNESFDIRCTCWVRNNDGTKNKQFLKCPMRHETTYEHIMNEYKYYKIIEKSGSNAIKDEIIKITKLTAKDWDIIVDIFEKYKAEDEDNE